MNSFISKILSRPYFVFSFLTVFVFMGIFSYFGMKRDLFPNSNRPEIALVVLSPSMSAKDIASTISLIIEKELYTIEHVRRVYSSTNDEVSVIRVEFDYAKDISEAASDVKNSFDKVRAKLPKDLPEPIIQKITQATAPIMVLALSSSSSSLSNLRELAEQEIKNSIMAIKGVADVDIFGGNTKELSILIDKTKLDTFEISIEEVINILKGSLQDYAIGVSEDTKERFIIKSTNTPHHLSAINELVIKQNIKLKDIAKVSFDIPKNSALYYGNAKPAIALAIKRNLDVGVLSVIEDVEKQIQTLQANYKNIDFSIADTQKTIIEQSTSNMIESLRDAIVMSMIVVFFFLASFRQIFVVLFTIPIVYLSTIAMMNIFSIEFNVITLTGVILALGLLLDDTVVVVENIERHFKTLGKPIKQAVYEGTQEIMFADFSGTLTTMIAIFPILFVGDYPQTVFGPLVSVLLLALVCSYIVSITFVPLVSLLILSIDNPFVLKLEALFERFSHSANLYATQFFIATFKKAMHSKMVALSYMLVLLFLVAISIRVVMPLVGQELMPAMDTGTISVKVSVDENLAIEESEKILKEILELINTKAKVISTSATIGSEAGVLGIGGGSISQIIIIANYINRFERDEDIWSIQSRLRKEISNIENIKRFEVSDAGATALASIKANLTITLMGDDFQSLYKTAKLYEEAMQKTKGVVNVSKTWDLQTKAYDISLDIAKLSYFGITQEEVFRQLKSLLKGVTVGTLPQQNALPIPIRVQIDKDKTDSVQDILALKIMTKLGLVSLSNFATIASILQPDTITRENLFYTIDILGFREKMSISHLGANFDAQSKHILLPQDIKMAHNGDIAQFQDSSGRIVKAVGVGIVLIFLVMIPMFESLKIPLVIILSIPLTIAGASWVLLLFDYHSSMSAMIGFILLAGVVVNNAILLIHFALQEMQNGLSAKEAILESIKLRTRPVLMTAISVSVGMIPVAFGLAIGLERLAPLGAVVIGGLLVGTFLTLVFIPLFFVWSSKEKTLKKGPNE